MSTIKSFKKFIEESIWSDIQDRSSGDTVRKEDDINTLDLNDFYAYIKDQYKTKVEYIDLDAMGGENGDVLSVDITENVILFYKPKRGHILLSWSRIKIPMPFLDELTDRFKVENPNAMRKIITEKDGSCTNKTFVDVIEFFLGHKGTIMNESIWSDIQDRSAGDTVRKEDEYDIDEKELERSVDICIKTYVRCSVYYDKYDGSSDTFLKCIQEWDRNICQNAQLYDRRFGKYVEPIKVIPSYVEKNWETGKSYKSLVEKKMSEEEKKVKDTGFIKKSGESISDTLSKWFDENFEKLGDDFCEEIEEYNDEYHSEGGSRSVDLGVEDWWDHLKYIEQVEIYQDYMKKTNESIWSDIQDRSSGDTVRKEDIITTNKDLRKKILELYKEQGEGETLDVSSLTNAIQCDDFSSLFQGYKNVKYIIGLEDWDVSKVTNMYSMFWDCKNFNSDLSNWDVSSVKDMGYMFWDCKNFNSDLSNWDVSSVKYMYGMFNNCTNFNSDLSNWDVSGVKNMHNMFDGCDSLKMKPSWYMKKLSKITESIWSDIQDRSSGDTVRQEDISEEDKKEIDYIFNGFAYLIVFTYYEPTIDDFIKMMKEAHPDKDNSKYIAWVKSNWDKKYKDELDKKIQYYKTYIDKKINRYLNHFVAQIVYCEKYNVSLIDIKKFADEVYKNGGMPLEMSSVGEIDVNESWYDIFKKYVDENWNDVKKRINDFIVEENQKIAKTGFKKTPGKKICDILDEWWYSLGDEKEDIAWDEFGERAEDKYYEEHDPEYNEYTGEDFEADDEWANASWIESVEIYMKYNQKTNESIWSDIQDRSSGDTVRKEDEMTQDDFIMLRATAKMFRVGVRNYSNPKKRKYTLKRIDGCDGFIDYILEKKKEHFWNDTPDEAYDKVIKFVKNNWGDCTGIQEFIDKCLYNINECDGVPGGLTPADVGGMGPAYFPGPNGEPGSGDLPSPTGIVYKQVAPFDTFIKIRKQKKKKKKKFRIEDEPCAHSKNPKIYNHVDDFRDYVDRVYSNIDKRK